MSAEDRPAGAPLDVIVVGAGASRRMGGVDKLQALIGGRPLLGWAIDAFAGLPEVDRIVVVVAPERVDRVRAAAWLSPRVSAVVAGGPRRQESVAAGVRALDGLPPATGRGPAPEDAVVLVHDGARPAVSPDLVRRVASAARRHGAAIPVVPVAETVKRLVGDRVDGTLDRTALALAQTPQGVRRSVIEAAWRRFPPDGPPDWTDEAALLEACTIAVHAVPGDPRNLKVTVPADLARAQALLQGSVTPRYALGWDTHPFGPGSPLMLGGMEVPSAPALLGHSDGDVALHAVADALLGAAGLGDVGRLFPADARTPAGIASSVLVREVVARLAASGLRPASVDVTIVGARPRLDARLDAMRRTIADLLGLPPERVSVTASTGNLLGPEGAGRAISASAIGAVEVVA